MDTLENGWDRLVEVTFEWLPLLIGALLLLIVGNIVARLLQRFVVGILSRVKLNKRLKSSPGGQAVSKAIPDATGLSGIVTYWLIFLGFIGLGASVLGIDAVNELVFDVYSYIPNVIAAVTIFVLGSIIASSATNLVQNTMGNTPAGRMVESLTPVIVIGITIFMILDQLNVATTIVTITYAALLGTVSLGTALAFGLGGRDVAGDMLEKSYKKNTKNKK